MIRLFRVFLILAITIGGIGFVLFQIIKFLGMTRWSSSRKEKERKSGLERAKTILDNPVPWRIKEMDLLAMKYDFDTDRGVFSSTKSGALNTIYGEPFIGFVVKQYSESDYLISFHTSDSGYSIFNSGRRAQVYKNDQKLWELKGHSIYSQKGEELGKIAEGRSFHSVMIGGKDVAHLQGGEEEILENTRAFQLVEEEKIQSTDIDVLTILVVNFLLERDVL